MDQNTVTTQLMKLSTNYHTSQQQQQQQLVSKMCKMLIIYIFMKWSQKTYTIHKQEKHEILMKI